MKIANVLRRVLSGHWTNQTSGEGRAGAVPDGAPGERTRGTEFSFNGPDLGAGWSALALPGSFTLGVTASLGKVVEHRDTEIIAHRAWRLTLDEAGAPVLQSGAHDTLWDGPSIVADEVPTVDNSNGIYALAKDDNTQLDGYGCVRGEVALSGTVVEGESGYRAERAVIRSLRLVANTLPDVMLLNLVDALEARYAVAVQYDAKALVGTRTIGNGVVIMGATFTNPGNGTALVVNGSNNMISGCSFR